MSEVKYPFRMTSIYNDGKNNIQSNYSGINAVKDFKDFAERNKLKWAILIDESNGKIIDSFNCQPERDTYRDLCAEMLKVVESAMKEVEREDRPYRGWHGEALDVITASKVMLGDYNAT